MMKVGEKVEDGVMVMKNGKAWGVTYQDGHSQSYGWVDPSEAQIRSPVFCKQPSDVTYENSPYLKELKDAEIVRVRRTTVVETLEN
jgi:hypothetical protein